MKQPDIHLSETAKRVVQAMVPGLLYTYAEVAMVLKLTPNYSSMMLKRMSERGHLDRHEVRVRGIHFQYSLPGTVGKIAGPRPREGLIYPASNLGQVIGRLMMLGAD